MDSHMPLCRHQAMSREEDGCRIESADIAARLRSEVAAVALHALERLSGFAPFEAELSLNAPVDEFFALYRHRPVKNNKGGSLFNDSLWLYVLARLFEPQLIVESGAYRGHSSWIFRQACPEADVYSFDVDLRQLVHRTAAVRYYQGDWTDGVFPAADDNRSLVFFDDHISQARRVREAYERGFRWLIFDDNFPVHNLYATGGPPVPTLAMIMDPTLRFGTEIRWCRNGRPHRYVYRQQDEGGAAALIEGYLVLPDLAHVTRYNPQSGLTVVKLVD